MVSVKNIFKKHKKEEKEEKVNFQKKIRLINGL